MKRPLLKIRIHPALPPVILLAAALGAGKLFCLTILAVTIHELAHVLTGRFFHLKTEEFILTPLGEVAVMKNREQLPPLPRIAIALAGPLVNFLLYALMTRAGYELFASINLALCLFNLLPVFPMDGARFWYVLLGNQIGVLPSLRLLTRVGRIIAVLLLLTGLLQVILFPYNISLICAAVFLLKYSRKEEVRLYYEFYQYFIRDRMRSKKILPVQSFIVADNSSVHAMLGAFRWDRYCVFLTRENETPVLKDTEETICRQLDSAFVHEK